MINLNMKLSIQEKNILKFRSDSMKLFLVTCLMMIVSIVFAYILTLCNSYNFLSYELGMIVGAITVILGLSVRD